MGVVSKNILRSYTKCVSILQKWHNVLDSYHHKDEGKIIKSVGDGQITLSDNTVVELGKEQFTDTQAAKLLASIFSPATPTLFRTPSSFEKGKETEITFSWAINLNEDVKTTFKLDGVDVPDTGTQKVTVTSTITKTLVLDRESGGNITRTTTSTAIVPRYTRKSTVDVEPTTFAYNTGGKVVNTSKLSFNAALNNEHLEFIDTNNNRIPRDVNTGFALSVGNWGDGVSFFYKKQVTVSLENEVTETMTVYRTRERKNQTLNVRLD